MIRKKKVCRDFSDPFWNGSGTCHFGKNSDILLQIWNFHHLVRCLFLYVLAHITVGFYYLAYVEIVRAGRIHKRHAFDYIAILIKILCPIWEIFLSYWEFFHQNWEKYILFCIGNGSFNGTWIYRQKNPWFGITICHDEWNCSNMKLKHSSKIILHMFHYFDHMHHTCTCIHVL